MKRSINKLTERKRNLSPIFHRDGTVSYFSVTNQVWVERAISIPFEDYQGFSRDDKEKAEGFFHKHGWEADMRRKAWVSRDVPR